MCFLSAINGDLPFNNLKKNILITSKIGYDKIEITNNTLLIS